MGMQKENRMVERPKTLKELIGKTLHSAQQEMVLTLPNRLMNAFYNKVHERDIDPGTGHPFTSFYRWLWLMPPDGCGLSGSQYLDLDDIVKQLDKSRLRLPESERGPVDALITDLVTGAGAKQQAGRKKKGEEGNGMINHPISNGTRGKEKSRSPTTLAARLAESKDPAHQAAWQGYLAGEYSSITAAAIACRLIKTSNIVLINLKHYWRRASIEERQTFVDWMVTQASEEGDASLAALRQALLA